MLDYSQIELQEDIDEQFHCPDYEEPDWQYIEEPFSRGRFFLLSIYLLLVGFIPLSRSFTVPFIGDSYMNHRMFFVLLLGLFAVILKLTAWSQTPLKKQTKKWFLWPFVLLGFIQICSIFWSNSDSQVRIYSFLTSLLLLASIYSGVALVSGLSCNMQNKMAAKLVVMLAGIIFIYILMSTRLAGLRPSASYYHREVLFGNVERLGGPLGGATGLNFILFPPLGYSIGTLFRKEKSKMFWLLVSFIFFISILFTGTVVAIIALLAMLMLTMFILRAKALPIILLLSLTVGILVMIFGVPERLKKRDIVYSSRFISYRTALRAFSSSPQAILFGVGQGTLYRPPQVYLIDENRRSDEMTRVTEFGLSLKGSHTTFLQSLSETGLIGFVFLITGLFWVFQRLFRVKRAMSRDPCVMQAKLTLIGCVATFVLMLFDVFFFYNSQLVIIWVIFVVIAVEVLEEAGQGELT